VEKTWGGIGNLQRLESTARSQKRRDCAGDLSRDQLAIAGNAEKGAAVSLPAAT